MQEYEKAFNEIKAATKLNEIDDLVKKFCQAETKNYSRFTYVRDLIAENEELDEEINRIQKEITKLRSEQEAEEQHKEEMIAKFRDNIGGSTTGSASKRGQRSKE